MIVDDTLDAHEAGLALVASRMFLMNSNMSLFLFWPQVIHFVRRGHQRTWRN